MPASKLTRRLFWGGETLLLAGTTAAAAWLSSRQEWSPLPLVVLLLMLAFFGELFTVETSHGVLSASLGAMVLAMGLLGPAPAAACGIAAMVMHSAAARRPLSQWLNNLCMYAVAPFAGGWMVRGLANRVDGVHSQHLAQSMTFGVIVLGALIVLLVLNFALFALDLRLAEGRALRGSCASCSFRCFPASSPSGWSRRSSCSATGAPGCRSCSPRSPSC